MNNKVIILSLLFSSTLIFGVNANENFIEDKNCKIALSPQLRGQVSFEDKGFSLATFKRKYKRKKGRKVLTSIKSVTSNALISRTSDLEKGKAELKASLNSINYSGVPQLRLYDRNNNLVEALNIKNNQVLKASLVNVFNKVRLKKTTKNWHELEHIPFYEVPFIQSKKFTLKSLAKKMLRRDSEDSGDEIDALKLIAGKRVSKSVKADLLEDQEFLDMVKKSLIYYKLHGEMSNDEFTARKNAAFPNCHISK